MNSGGRSMLRIFGTSTARMWGSLLGSAVCCWAGDVHASKLRVVYTFAGGTDASEPGGALIRDAQGNLYGTTLSGGAYGDGTVFKVARDGTETVLYSFAGGSDGMWPDGVLVRDRSGNLFGTTYLGGASSDGTVFKLSADGSESVLHTFTGADGAFPSGLIEDNEGNLYGTAAEGGDLQGCGGLSCGVVFEVAADGTETALHTFIGGSDGADPAGSLIMDNSGNLFGTTVRGGGSGCANNLGVGCGTVFKLAPDGSETILYTFSGPDGAYPQSNLIWDAAGNLYGTAEAGGPGGEGAVFRLAPDGVETVLYSFTGGSDGGFPYAGVIADSAGNFYGTTYYGGSSGVVGDGTVFKLLPDGREKVLHAFTGGADGSNPLGGLLADKTGHMFGTTQGGGTNNTGVVFKINE
jgi:uncharacterized repeat protein (TIGR03803 family)